MKHEKLQKFTGLALLLALAFGVVYQGRTLYGLYQERNAPAPPVEFARVKESRPAPVALPFPDPVIAPGPELRRLPEAVMPFLPPTPRVPSSPFADPFFDSFFQGQDRHAFRRDIDRLFSDLNNLDRFAGMEERGSMGMRVDQTETDYVVTLDTGADELDGLNVGVSGKQLTVSGVTRRIDKGPVPEGVARPRSERSFLQSFPLPGPVMEDEVVSDFKDGVLTITLPKKTV